MEKDIERYLRLKVKKAGGLALKFTSPGFTGVHDRIVLFSGQVFFVELKSESGKPSKRQKYVHKQFAQLGFKTHIISSKEQADNFIDEIHTT